MHTRYVPDHITLDITALISSGKENKVTVLKAFIRLLEEP